MESKAAEIISKIKKQIFHPVYLLEGEEPYYIDVVSDFIEKNLLPESERGFNQTVVYGKDVTARQVGDLCRRYPMFGNYQLIIVKEAADIKDWDELIAYVEKPLKSTILVLCHKHKNFDKRKKIYKVLQANAEVLSSKKIYDDKLPGFVAERVIASKRKIDLQAAAMIADYIGNDLERIVNELEKLFISVKEGETITAALIEKNIGISKEYNVFELNNALGDKDILKANRIINYFSSDQKSNPLVVTIGTLYSYFTKLLLIKSNPQKNKTEIAAITGTNPFFVDGLQRSAMNYSLTKLHSIMQLLNEYDLKSKGMNIAKADDSALLRELIYKILH